ncbi:MAG: hypothetical protein R2800_10650 [Flavipsychrobacter sp.]
MYIKRISSLLACCLFIINTAYAQKEKGENNSASISIGSGGIEVSKDKKKDKKEEAFNVKFGGVDIGIISLQDQTNYNSTAAQSFLNVPQASRNENLFDLNSGKSINVNVWLVEAGWNLLKKYERQKIIISSGVGLQMYNFRFNKQITYTNETVPSLHLDTLAHLTKNKLGFTFLSVPLNLTFKTKAGKKTWLVYGIGATGGYRIASWTKQISPERGKQKNRDPFNFNDFNACLTAQVGLDGYFRLYTSYQITPLHETALTQYPLSIGIRIGGI